MSNFIARLVEPGKIPPVQGLDLLKLQVEAPKLWSESYKIYGEHQGTYTLTGDDGPISRFSSYWYFTRCLVCNNHDTREFNDKFSAVHAHFLHCAKSHGYIFPADYDNSRFKVVDCKLQQLIQDCQVYNLPFYGYDDHTECIKQYRHEPDGKQYTVCAVHKGNEP